ncbi:N-alpha-acetyltransferase 30-like [Arapaima gigas]
MAEVPPGPNSTLPAPAAEILTFAGSGYNGCGEVEERSCGCVNKVSMGARQPQTYDVKGATKTNRNHLFSHSTDLHFHTQPPHQVNGLMSPAESHDCVHFPAHRPPLEYGDTPDLNNLSFRNDESEEHRSCPKSKPVEHSKNINNVLSTDSRTDGITDRLAAGAAVLRIVDGKAAEDAAVPRGQMEPDPLGERVMQMERLHLSGASEQEEQGGELIEYVRYESELQMPDIMRLITKDLSEPYSIYTYRYFIHNWPQLCFLAMVQNECVGAIVCKLDIHKKMFRRGYIAMLAVDSKYRRKSIGTNLVKNAIYAMVDGNCDEVVLETEITNKSALKLYENLGFVRDKRLFRYYLNGVDALRLKLWLR